MKFNVFEKMKESAVRESMELCNTKNHFQQAIYSIYGSCFTVICFHCKKVRTTLNMGD